MYDRATSNALADKRIAGGINGCMGLPSENYVTVFPQVSCADTPDDREFPVAVCCGVISLVLQPGSVGARIKRDAVHVSVIAACPLV